jgi:ABC-2 type transport system permease protein
MTANTAVLKGAPAQTEGRSRRTGFKALYVKELSDYFRGYRFMILLVLITVLSGIFIYIASQGFQQAIEDNTYGDSQFMFLTLFTGTSGSIFSFYGVMALFGPIVGLSLGFDAINGERSRRTLSRLLAQPIYRDAVVNGKFLAGVTVITVLVFSVGLAISGVGMVLIGLVPTLEEFLRILVFLTFTVVYLSLFLAISLLLSIALRHVVTSALTGVGLWLLFAIFFALLASLIAGALYPVTDNSTYDQVLQNVKCSEAIGRLSPTTLYSEAGSAILNPNLRSITSAISVSQYYQTYYNAVSGSLPLGQSLLLVWPHLTGLLALTMVCFIISYVVFMKQEIRAE